MDTVVSDTPSTTVRRPAPQAQAITACKTATGHDYRALTAAVSCHRALRGLYCITPCLLVPGKRARGSLNSCRGKASTYLHVPTFITRLTTPNNAKTVVNIREYPLPCVRKGKTTSERTKGLVGVARRSQRCRLRESRNRGWHDALLWYTTSLQAPSLKWLPSLHVHVAAPLNKVPTQG